MLSNILSLVIKGTEMEYKVVDIHDVLRLSKNIDSIILDDVLDLGLQLFKATIGYDTDDRIDAITYMIENGDYYWRGLELLLVMISMVVLDRRQPWAYWNIYTANIRDEYLEFYVLSRRERSIVDIWSSMKDSVILENITPICNMGDVGLSLDIVYGPDPLYENIYLYPLYIATYIDAISIVVGRDTYLLDAATSMLDPSTNIINAYRYISHNADYHASMILAISILYREMILLDKIMISMPNRECYRPLTMKPRHDKYYTTDITIHTMT